MKETIFTTLEIFPEKGHLTDACFDVIATGKKFDRDLQCFVYETDLKIEIPEGHQVLAFPRSSIRKYDLTLANGIGVIDQGYINQIMFSFKPLLNIELMNRLAEGARVNSESFKSYDVGDKIGQIQLVKVIDTDWKHKEKLESSSDRGMGGHGSTGK